MAIKRRVQSKLFSEEGKKRFEEQRRREKEKAAAQEKTEQEQQANPIPTESFSKEKVTESTKPQLRKKEKFVDRHQRVTTYLLKENHKKVNEIKETYGIPVSETVNNALKEYINKYNL